VDGQGGIDLYVSRLDGDAWSTPENIVELNTTDHDGWPYLSPDGTELFFTRTYLGSPGIFRSRWNGERWSEAELIVSQFAGEPTLDTQGNLYFVHHYYQNGVMLDADIYVAYRK
jgi:Tol biopolymer transport system component